MSNIRNVFYNTLTQIVSIFFPLILIPFLARTLGPEGLGVFSYTQTILQFFLVIGVFGLDVFGQKKIALDKSCHQKTNQTFSNILFLRFTLLLIILLLYIIIISIFFLNYRIFLYLSIIYIVSSMFDLTWFYIGIEDYKIIASRNVLIKVVAFILVLIYIKNIKSLPIYILINGGANLLSNLLLLYNIITKKIITFIRPNIDECKKIIKISYPILLFQVVTVAGTLVTRLLIIKYLNTIDLGVYDTILRMVLIIVSLICSIPGAFIARLSVVAEKSVESIEILLGKMIALIGLFALPAAGGLMCLSATVSDIFLGSSFPNSKIILFIASPIIYFNSISYVVGSQYQVYCNKVEQFTTTLIYTFFIGILLYLFAIPKYGNIGTITVSLFLEALITNIHFIRSRKSVNFYKIIVYNNWKQLISTLIMCTVLMGIKKANIVTSPYTLLFFNILIGALIYELFLLFFHDKCNSQVIKIFIKKKNFLV